MLQEYVRNVLAVSVLCCSACFHGGKLQVFYLMLHMFHTCVASVLSGSCISFTHTLQVFHLDVAKVDLVLHILLWLYAHVSSVSSVLDVCCKCFHLDISKVYLGEHMLSRPDVVPAHAGHGRASCVRRAQVQELRTDADSRAGRVRGRELRTSDAGARALSDTSTPDRMFER